MGAEKKSLKLYSLNRQDLIAAAVAQTNEGIAISDMEGNILFVNEAFTEMHGYEIDELHGKNLTIFHTPDQLESVRNANETLINNGFFKGEIWHVHKDGTVFPTLMNNSLLVDENDQPIGLIGTVSDITETKKNQQKLLESEERFRSLYENATIGIYRTTPAGDILLANPALVEMLGYDSFAELRQRNLESNGFHYDSPRSKFREMLEQKGVVRGVESAWIKNNNEIVYVRESARSILDEEGKTRYFEGMVEDISSRKIAEDLLEDSEKKYRLIAQNSRDVIFTLDLDLKLGYISPSVEILTGYTDEEFMSMPVNKLVPPESQKIIYQSLRVFRRAQLESSGEKVFQRRELEILRKDGSAIWAEIIGSVVWDENGKYLSINGVARDITKRKKAELALHRSDAILHAVSYSAGLFISSGENDADFEEALRTLGESTDSHRAYILECSDDIEHHQYLKPLFKWVDKEFSADSENTLLKMNFSKAPFKSWKEKFSRNDSISGPVKRFPGDQREFFQKARIKSLALIPIYVGSDWWGILGFDDCQQERDWTRKEMEALTAAAKTIGAVIQRNWALEERKKLEEKIRQSKKLESLGILASGIAHDFNNLLQAIVGNTDLMLMELPDQSVIGEYIEEINQSVKQASKLTDQMLVYSGKAGYNVESVNLTDKIVPLKKFLRAVIPPQVNLSFNLDQQIPRCEIDADFIEQLIASLVTNAFEALPDEKGEIQVTTGKMYCGQEYFFDAYLGEDLPEGEYVFLEVKDNGCGMEPETLNRIFDPFFTTKFAGRGMGLAAVFGIARSQNSAIKVHTEPDKGSTFRVLFPVSTQSAEQEKSRYYSPVELTSSGTVILADTVESHRNIGKRMLERLGFSVFAESDAEEVQNILNRGSEDISLIIIDLSSVKTDRIQYLRQLKNAWPNIRIIISSELDEDELEGEAGLLEEVYSISKPFRLSQLQSLLEKIESDTA